MADPPLLTPIEASEFLGVSRRWLIRDSGIARNQPPGSRKIRYRREVLEEALRSWDTPDHQIARPDLRRDENGKFRSTKTNKRKTNKRKTTSSGRTKR